MRWYSRNVYFSLWTLHETQCLNVFRWLHPNRLAQVLTEKVSVGILHFLISNRIPKESKEDSSCTLWHKVTFYAVKRFENFQKRRVMGGACSGQRSWPIRADLWCYGKRAGLSNQLHCQSNGSLTYPSTTPERPTDLRLCRTCRTAGVKGHNEENSKKKQWYLGHLKQRR